MTEYEKQQLENQQKEQRLKEEVRTWFNKHPDVRFCDAKCRLAGTDYMIIGIEKLDENMFVLKNYMGGNNSLTHYGLDVLASVVSAMPED